MSKKCKAEAKKRRLSKKRSRKAAQKALYETRMRAGQNTKSKRVRLRAMRARKTRGKSGDHPLGPCGNIGCKRCNPAPWNLTTPVHRYLALQ